MGKPNNKLNYKDEKSMTFIRIFDCNINGSLSCNFGLRNIKGVGIRMSNVLRKILKKDINYKLYNIEKADLEEVVNIFGKSSRKAFPSWLMNRRADFLTGDNLHVLSTVLDSALQEDIKRLVTIKNNKGLRHLSRLKTRGQHTKSNGRRGKTIGVVRKKK
ncbi:ribosomal protein S18 (nucleomorph) [Bigelowiella natans]|uniref:Ribosomal protein S18 n=1 Tax=Bigelowiella natans TaxID=227086 RepID=Q3LW54_BIGNA|nr:ribosomal protein S18 [Bigelowiella natans]ABA27311.1 ribosomal protein S18 [Bigelowiella natans]|mmetsp:Transcript_43382/g.69849  ORF Transcript_43382/g.69849 Transcript_43382/m.69849 type:complete len:160 (+) Transcript_43382:49-528(+)